MLIRNIKTKIIHSFFANLCIFAPLWFLLFLTSCSESTTHEQENKTVFRYNVISRIKSLDPAFSSEQFSIWADNQLYNGLVQLNDQLGIEACIAKSWEISSDKKTYTFHLRNDVFFHDHELFKNGKGRKVNAKDFVYSFSRILDPELASPGIWIFNNIDTSHANSVKGFRALNDSTFQIFLKNAFSPFPGMLSMQYCSVLPKEIVDYYGDDFGVHPIGTGPFKFKMWKENEKLIFTKNENYFEYEGHDRLPYLDAVSISFLQDKQAEYLAFMQDKLDFISGIDPSFKDELLTPSGDLNPKYASKIQMISQPYLNTEYLGFLMDTKLDIVKNSPLRKKEIRQALNYGFDRNKMIAHLRNNIGSPGISGFIPNGLPSYDTSKVKGYYYDQEKARALLSQAGFPEGKGLAEIELHTTASYLDLCEYIQHQLSEIGIKIKLEVDPPASLKQYMAKSGVEFFRGSWIADYGEAENYLALFYSKNFAPNGPNYTHFKDKRFDELYEKSIKEVNDSIRYNYYQQMDQIIIENAPIIVLYYDEVLRFIHKNIEGLGSNPLNLLTLKKVKKKLI
jgi:peptide/nickel transport system substrate-binding protein